METHEGDAMTTAEGRVQVAYFSMEIALDPAIPTYSGGLGVLAGDMLRSAADLELPMAGITLAYRKGYFRQKLDARGQQTEEPDAWQPELHLGKTEGTARIQIEGRDVHLRAWRYDVSGSSGRTVPVFLLDADLEMNSPWDRTLTDSLYGGDSHYRICQEAVLGMGGVAMLRSLGFDQLEIFHMNEGHSAFLVLALLKERLGERDFGSLEGADIEAVRRQCVFTTHTPVPAGHDQFAWDLVERTLGEPVKSLLGRTTCGGDASLNMTDLALGFSRYVNGVAMRHGEVSHDMFPRYPIHSITNGVHALTWTSPPFQELYDREIKDWRRDNAYLRYAVGIPLDKIQESHRRAKRELIEEVSRRCGAPLDESVLTIGFARRAAAYKRADLLFSHPERLRAIAHTSGALQVIYAGKAHPGDEAGKALIRRIFEVTGQVQPDVRVFYLESYDWTLAKLITAGVDLWLNTPQRPREASGTSGMKAALNGVPSFSVLDGWWIEGCFEGVTGWAIGGAGSAAEIDARDEVESLYQKLENVIAPMFYRRPEAYAEVMRSAIAVNASFFNTQRMVAQYTSNAYFPETLLPVPEQPEAALRPAQGAEVEIGTSVPEMDARAEDAGIASVGQV